MNGWVVAAWFAGALVLLGGEALTGQFALLMLSAGAAAAGVTALAAPLWVQVIVFAIASLALLVGVRPILARKFNPGEQRHVSYVESLPGRTATAVGIVGSKTGSVRIGEDIWSARALGADIDDGALVTVVHIDGATAVVVAN